jgi:protein-S-isoprenylcysteine O-methyltransferase Ste14
MPLLTKIPPPAALVGTIAGAVLMTWSIPLLQGVCFHAPLAAAVVALAAGAWAGWAAREFRRYRTTILPHRQPTSLLCAGPFGVSRNPLYLAMLALATLPWLAWGQLGLLLAPLGFFSFINWVIIPFEEARLHGIFGDAYTDYARRVRRWL